MIAVLALAAGTAGADVDKSYSFGHRGADGWNGPPGRDGRDGPSLTVFADGSPVFLDLSGESGTDGGYGGDGQNAQGCYFTPGAANMQGAPGGDGGNAGRGGNAGDGGNLVVQYDDVANLRAIRVDSRPGYAGRTGYPGQGGHGCHCPIPNWRQRVCWTDPNTNHERCEDRSFYCTQGQEGRGGYQGSNGRLGNLGRAVLVGRRETLGPERPEARVLLRAEDLDRPIALSRDRWSVRSGAGALFSPGSILANEYSLFEGRQEYDARVHWSAGRPISDFEGSSITLRVGPDGPGIDVPRSLWAVVGEETEGRSSRFDIQSIVTEDEAKALQLKGFQGTGSGLVAEFIDPAGVSRWVDTRFDIELATRKLLFFWAKRFRGTVPADLVTAEAGAIHVAIGRLPIDGKWLAEGRKIRLRARAVRSLGERSTELRYQARHKIGT